MSREELTGRKCYEIWGDGTSVCADCPVAQAMKTGEPQEAEKQTSDGRCWCVRGYPLRDETGGVVGAIEMTRDITERKRAEEQAKWYQERLLSLAMELSLAEERERRRLAANLHDNLTQNIGLIQIKLSLLRQTPNKVERQTVLQEIEELVGRSIASSRSLTLQLSHPVLYDLGFVAGAQWLAEDVQALYGLKVSVKDDGCPKPLDERIRVVLFQCLREVLINASKHARVDDVRVRIERCHDDSVRVTVRDRGVGFDPAVLDNRSTHGFGLFSIRERLQHLRGHVEIRSKPGKGTTVMLTVPISLAPPAAEEGTS
jgi:signal transduction histidine kinase